MTYRQQWYISKRFSHGKRWKWSASFTPSKPAPGTQWTGSTQSLSGSSREV